MSFSRCWISLFLVVLACDRSSGQSTISIGLFSKSQISSVTIAPASGQYVLMNEQNDTVYIFRPDDAVSLTASDSGTVVKGVYGLRDTLKRVHITGSGIHHSVKVRPQNDPEEHVYADDLSVSCVRGKLGIINNVGMENYVSSVVQAEVGSGAVPEFYKIQSIICRTYAVKNLVRHANEGFDLCDRVHCQVYSGLVPATDAVVKATASTQGLVMVDRDNSPILAAFHSNCGGQTANSENVWAEPRHYLVSVIDTFCLSARNATWKKTVSTEEFLQRLNLDTDISALGPVNFDQPKRMKQFQLGGITVNLQKMRRQLALPSAFFDISIKHGEVVFNGRGSGHGVGLCQQGAMRMAEYSYSYSQILGYYYKNVSLMPIGKLR